MVTLVLVCLVLLCSGCNLVPPVEPVRENFATQAQFDQALQRFNKRLADYEFKTEAVQKAAHSAKNLIENPTWGKLASEAMGWVSFLSLSGFTWWTKRRNAKSDLRKSIAEKDIEHLKQQAAVST